MYTYTRHALPFSIFKCRTAKSSGCQISYQTAALDGGATHLDSIWTKYEKNVLHYGTTYCTPTCTAALYCSRIVLHMHTVLYSYCYREGLLMSINSRAGSSSSIAACNGEPSLTRAYKVNGPHASRRETESNFPRRRARESLS